MTLPVLTTKLYIPPARPDLIHRARLTARLDDGIRRRLTLLAAPAGFGKTTLLSEWGAGRPGVAWLTLDGGDNDPIRFCAHLVAALQRLAPGAGEATMALLRSAPAVDLTAALTVLVNDLTTLTGDAVLVLDDYHLITAQPVHDAVAFLLEQGPPQLHLLIAGQTDPPLPLARLRVRDEVVEIRAADLRFLPDETALFIRLRAGVDLPDEDLSLLDARTEGWAAGLQLAALAIRQGPDEAGAFLRAFSGSHRLVLDYLAEEVFRRCPESLQSFLLRTAVLEQLSAPLCEALTGQAGAQSLLEQLDRQNLFVVPLDSERRWYRLHHLFRTFLTGLLQQCHPQWLPDLHRAAARWLEQNGQVAEAVPHWLGAGEHDLAAAAIAGVARRVILRAESVTLLGWAEALPTAVLDQHARLNIYYAWALQATTQVSAATRRLDMAEALLRAEAEPDPQALAELAALRVPTVLVRGDYDRAAALAREAVRLAPEDDWLVRGMSARMLSRTYWMQGNVAAALQAGEESAAIVRRSGMPGLLLTGLSSLGRLRAYVGHLRTAADLFRETMDRAREMNADRSPLLGVAFLGLAEVLAEQGDLEGARTHVEEGIRRTRPLGNAEVLGGGFLMLARILLNTGEPESALLVLDEAEKTVRRSELGQVAPLLGASRARTLLAMGDTAGAARWAEAAAIARTPHVLIELEQTVLARVLAATGRRGEAAALLEALLAHAEASGRFGSVIKLSVQLAGLLLGGGDQSGALRHLRRARELGEPEGYRLVFREEGPEVLALLQGSAQKAPAEPLSERELEVLRLLADGHSNQEIARRLVVTEGTAKWHVHNVLAKLGAASRTQAAALARQLGLLP